MARRSYLLTAGALALALSIAAPVPAADERTTAESSSTGSGFRATGNPGSPSNPVPNASLSIKCKNGKTLTVSSGSDSDAYCTIAPGQKNGGITCQNKAGRISSGTCDKGCGKQEAQYCTLL